MVSEGAGTQSALAFLVFPLGSVEGSLSCPFARQRARRPRGARVSRPSAIRFALQTESRWSIPCCRILLPYRYTKAMDPPCFGDPPGTAHLFLGDPPRVQLSKTIRKQSKIIKNNQTSEEKLPCANAGKWQARTTKTTKETHNEKTLNKNKKETQN